MRIRNPLIDHSYGGLSMFGISTVILGLIAAFAVAIWGAWMIWGNHNSCTPPNHLVYAYTEDVLVGKILVPEDFYYCEAN